MPELPDIVVYIEALQERIAGEALKAVSIASPFLLRTADPPISSVYDRKVIDLRRLGKRICIGFEEDIWLVLHLMIAGRLHWLESAKRPSRKDQASFVFTSGTLALTEAGSQRRASLHLVQGEKALRNFDSGGIEIFETDLKEFGRVLQSSNHTLKRALTDPRLFSGIGNAYSDEILWEAQLSPIALTQKLTFAEIERLFKATQTTLSKWVDQLRAERSGTGVFRGKSGEGFGAFPEKVTAFRKGMAVHGRYQMPCPRCETSIQRIRYASNETNYCPRCQTGGKLLADRALSRLLRGDWPRTLEELESLK